MFDRSRVADRRGQVKDEVGASDRLVNGGAIANITLHEADAVGPSRDSRGIPT
jgi:hypothetical protein